MDLTAAGKPTASPRVSEAEWKSSEWAIITTLAFVAIAGTGSSAIIYAATPMLSSVFTDPKVIGWMSSIYFIVGAIAAGLCGGIGDLYGRRATLIWVLLLVSVAGVVAGLQSDPNLVVAAHAVQGLGVAVPTLNIGLIREHVSPKRVPMAIAVVTTATTASAGLFFMLSGYVLDYHSWRYIFWFGPLLLVPAVLFLMAVVPGSRPAQAPRAIPFLNGVLFGLAALFLMLGIGELSQGGLALAPVGWLIAGAVFIAGWVFHSLRTPTPMVDVRLLQQPGLAAIIVVYALLSLSLMHFGHVILFIGKAAAHDGYGAGLSSTVVAAIMAPQGFLGLLTGPLAGFAVQRFGHYKVFLACLCTAAIPYFLLLAVDHAFVTLLMVVLISGFVTGALMPGFRIALQEEVDEARASSAMGLAELSRALCMGVGAQIVAAALASKTVGPGEAAGLDPTRFTLLMVGFLALIALAAGIYARFGSRQGKIA
ncbi:MFS transporter [Phenylobacterium sp. LjRoot225]|uniref:MFS transporter n=1 Tax=Phenylobacterium sp. LjRoot225 TaxID=3342285 RepID=UPI003ED0E0F5